MDGPGTYSQPPYAGGSKDESGTAAKDTISIGSGDRVSGEDRMGMEVHTLMETAKANNLRLEAYIEHLLAVLPERFADDLEADIDDLLPWADAMQKRFAMFGTGT